MLLRVLMQLVPNKIPEPRLVFSMDAEEAKQAATRAQSPIQMAPAAKRRSRSPALALTVLVILILAIGAVIGWERFAANGDQLFPTFIKARTNKLAAPDSIEAAPVITIQLSPDMIRVSAIALGHPRLAVINGQTVAEGDAVTLQAPNSSVALTLRVAKIADGSIIFSDGKKMFSAQLTIPSPPQPKQP
jgi:hypothetical protein